jgi:signal peptidase II
MKKCIVAPFVGLKANLCDRPIKWIIPLSIGVVTLVLDIITKYLIEAKFSCSPSRCCSISSDSVTTELSQSVEFLGGFLKIHLVHNKGGVFGILQGYAHVFLIVSIIVLIFMIIFWIYEKNKSMMFNITMSLIVSGAIGNIIDRIIPSREGVVDFISIGVDGVYRWPSFNIADSCIVVGAIFLIIVFYRSEKQERLANAKKDK